METKTQQEPEKEHYTTECLICGSKNNEIELVSCDHCKAEYHFNCLYPLPEANWTYPNCPSEYKQLLEIQRQDYNNFTRILKKDKIKMDQLLIHASFCNDSPNCSNQDFKALCPSMKRYLRCARWASHNDHWISSKMGQRHQRLFAYHAINCESEFKCQVPMCQELQPICLLCDE